MLRSVECVNVMKAGAVISALFAFGCATQAQKQFQAMITNDKAASEKVATCAAAVYN
jgi:hypothetical protein